MCTIAQWPSVLTLAALALAGSTAAAQVPILREPGKCGGWRVAPLDAAAFGVPEPRKFSVQDSGFCSQYSHSGWEKPLRLYLGEGAFDYRPLIESAVSLWNTALRGFSRTDVIQLDTLIQPRTYTLSEQFWSNPEPEYKANLGDGQSVIYFKGGGDSNAVYSFAYLRTDRDQRMVESDIYINTTHEDLYGNNLALTELLFPVDAEHGVYTLVNSTFVTILHELGHAIGLAHVPVSGNIMSYHYMPGVGEAWEVPLALALSAAIHGQTDADPNTVSQLPFVSRHADITPYMVVTEESLLSQRDLFTLTTRLGEQDRIALMCVYDFDDWNDSP